jgi:heme/copper-type cytochrome/quinol oxidase subunit 2
MTSGLRPIVAITATMIAGAASDAAACPVCFGAEETPLIDGAKLGMLAMLGVTFAVQGAFAGFFLYLRRRAKDLADADLDSEWSDLQRGSRTS